MNPVAERFVDTLRCELLDHLLLFDERHLDRVPHEKFAAYFNSARPHQGLHQRIPEGPVTASSTGPIVVRPFLGGLHHDYRRAA